MYVRHNTLQGTSYALYIHIHTHTYIYIYIYIRHNSNSHLLSLLLHSCNEYDLFVNEKHASAHKWVNCKYSISREWNVFGGSRCNFVYVLFAKLLYCFCIILRTYYLLNVFAHYSNKNSLCEKDPNNVFRNLFHIICNFRVFRFWCNNYKER